MRFENSFFFGKNYLNLNKNKTFNKYLLRCEVSAKYLLSEYKNNSNEILNSFTYKYQKKINFLKKKLILNKNKKTVVIGMGGSSSGAKAISSYLKKDIIFFDNLDYNFFLNFVKKENIFNYNYFIISKSGDTYETLALTNLLIRNIFRKKKNFELKKILYVISDPKNSLLLDFAKKHNLAFIEHNEKIGGRFSILSETSLLPIQKINLNIHRSCEFFIKILKNSKHNLSPIINASLILYFWKHKKFSTYVNLIYDYRFKHLSYWFHQLHAESLGKNGHGLLPYTSICPKDHHSMLQLFLDGPKNKIFNIFKPPKKNYGSFSKLGFSNIECFTPSSLLEKQFIATVKCFKENNIPHRIIEFEKDYNPDNIFKIISYFILETIILGYSVGINPYDQPAVQQVKEKITKG